MAHITILGAGVAGLSSGWLLKQAGIGFTILEKQNVAGGLARSFEWHGFSCDFAAHRLFTSDENVLKQLLNLVPMGRQVRRSRIYLRGHWMRDPLDVVELAQKLGMNERLSILWSYAFRSRRLEEVNFENFVLSRYGSKLYEYFFKPYTEKLFGIPGQEISISWARQKVRLASPFDHIRENTKTKFQYFYYPVRGGYGAIVDRLYDEIKENVILGSAVMGFKLNGDRVQSVEYRMGDQAYELESQAVISTLPLPISTRMLGHPLQFKFKKVEAVYLLVNKPQVSDYHWTYFIDSDIAINRLVEFKNMSPVDKPAEVTVLCAEVTQDLDDPTGKVMDDLHRVGLVNREDVLDTHLIREEFAYPVYTRDFDEQLKEAGKVLSSATNLHVLGRAAEFQHREVDDLFDAASILIRKISAEIQFTARPVPAEVSMAEETTAENVYAVILTYNHYEDTRECLSSLLASNNHDFQVLVVDNGSTDGTPDKVRQEFPSVQVIENNENLGVPAGFNVGFRHALQNGAGYILMLNNDTILKPDMLNILLDQARSDPQAGILMPRVLYHGSETEVWSSGGRYRRFPPAILMTEGRKKQLETSVRLIEYAPSCGLLIHRRAFERAGLFDPGYFFFYDDWDFSERVRAHGLNIWYMNDAVLWHKVSRTTQGPRSSLFWYTMGASMARYYRRHGRPVWLSSAAHIGYFIFREFVWKRNVRFWPDYRRGLLEGMRRPLGSIPSY